MDILYDTRYHFHLGFYEENCDYESIALKRQFEDIWDVFLDFKEYRINNITTENEFTLESFGTRIFSIYNKEVNYDIGVQQFKQWLYTNKLI